MVVSVVAAVRLVRLLIRAVAFGPFTRMVLQVDLAVSRG